MTVLRICFIGDSLTLGTNDDEYLGWPGRIAKREHTAGHDVTVYNLGVRADTSEMIAVRWRAECEARLPDIHPAALVFSFGINDSAIENDAQRVEHDRSLEIARTMITEAKAWKPTIWIGPPPVDDERQPLRPGGGIEYSFASVCTARLSDAYADLAKELNVPYLDLFTALASGGNWDSAFEGDDGVHPKDTGYAEIAERVAGWEGWRNWFD